MNPLNNSTPPVRDNSKKVDGDGNVDKMPPTTTPTKPFQPVMEKRENEPKRTALPKKKTHSQVEGDADDNINFVADESDEEEAALPNLLTLSAAKKIKQMVPDKSSDSETSETELEEEASVEAEGKVAITPPDPSKKTISWESFSQNTQTPVSTVKQSPFAVYKQMAAGNPKRPEKPFATDVSADPTGRSPKTSLSGDKKTNRYQPEQSDLAAVNPMGSPIVEVSNLSNYSLEMPKETQTAHIQELVDQIVKELYVIETAGKTDTILVLKQPTIFNDARVVLTSFNASTKEFNIAFENLAPQAKQLIDQNLNTLRTSLEEHGYANAVHIISTTTFIEHNIPTESGKGFAQRDRESGDEQQKQQKRNPYEPDDLA